MKWVTEEDGWQAYRRRDGGTDYRILASDTGRPAYAGASRRYAEVYLLPEGTVFSKSAAGFSRRHDTLADAKASVSPTNFGELV